MNSWWSLGEGSGFMGTELALYKITCAFCKERGNFELTHHAEKKKPNSSTKKINFDLYQCGNCTGYVQVMWSGSEHGKLHDYHTLPWVIGKKDAPEHWPEDIQRFWLQTHSNLKNENWDAAAVMLRSALQLALRDKGASNKDLRSEIDDLSEKGLIPPIMKDWSHELRILGNSPDHPSPKDIAVKPADVKDAGQFLDYFLKYLYDLPEQIKKFRERKEETKSDES